jgi:hypothetical protein
MRKGMLITDHELGGLMSELATTDGPTTGRTRFSDWIADAGRFPSWLDRVLPRIHELDEESLAPVGASN